MDQLERILENKTAASNTRRFKRRTTAAVWIAALVGLSLLLLWCVSDLVLLVFLGVLFAIFLRSLSDVTVKITKLNSGVSLSIVILLLLITSTFMGWVFAGDMADQVDELSETIPRAAGELLALIKQSDLGRRILAPLSRIDQWLSPSQEILTNASGFVSATFGLLVSSFVVFLIGIYLAYSPKVYLEGLLVLIPHTKQERIRGVFYELKETLQWWLIGKVISMFAIGALTIIGLKILGIPLALGLGTLAGLLSFIPNIGPILSAAPAILLALVQSPILAFNVTLLYIGVQAIEGNILTPYIEKKTILLPPALTIVMQVLFGILFGFLGVLLAAPLTAVGMVVIRSLYVEDVLGRGELG